MIAMTQLLADDDRLGSSDCEAFHQGLIAQPSNALTSLAYVVAGAWVATRVARLPRADRTWAWAYAIVLVLVGLGSVDFHGTQSPVAKPLHDGPIGILVLLGAMIAVRGWRRRRDPFPGWGPRVGVALAVTAVGAPVAFVLGRTAAAGCDPSTYLQLHGLWHILTAVGFALIFQVLFGAGTPDAPAGIDEAAP
jgi:peptidoglycan/LPS O-acetylase OafA/YrhL